MPRQSIKVGRTTLGRIRSVSIATDALNALANIPGVEDANVIKESDEEVVIQYNWIGGEDRFMQTDELLNQYGLERVEAE